MTLAISGTTGITLAGQFDSASTFGWRNRIINGGMVIDQRNAGASVNNTAAGLGTYTLDRWLSYGTAATKFSIQQNAGGVTPPAGFINYLGATSSAATTVASTDLYYITQRLEGFNVSDLAWGTANAKTVTLSFQVYSSLTGTFGGALLNSAGNRSYPFSYTISSANTWTQISITVAGDTTGTWLTNNGIGIAIVFGLGIGSTYNGTAGAWAGATYLGVTGATSVVGTSGATFYITGVQLEKGSTATSFDFRSYGTELALCQRYCVVFALNTFFGTITLRTGGTSFYANVPTTVPMRSSPTPTGTTTIFVGDNSNTTTVGYTLNGATLMGSGNITSVGANGDCGLLYATTANILSSEL